MASGWNAELFAMQDIVEVLHSTRYAGLELKKSPVLEK